MTIVAPSSGTTLLSQLGAVIAAACPRHPTARSERRGRWRRACRCRSGPDRASARPPIHSGRRGRSVIVAAPARIWVATSGVLLKLAASPYAAIISMPCSARTFCTSSWTQPAGGATPWARAGAATMVGGREQRQGDHGGDGEERSFMAGSRWQWRDSRNRLSGEPARSDETRGAAARSRHDGAPAAVRPPARPAQSTTLARPALTSARTLLPSSRRSREARVGRVGLRDRRHFGGAGDELVQARQRVAPVELLAAMALRLDDDDAFVAEAPVGAAEQARLDRLGQRRRGDVEAQVDRARDLVDVLAARALRAHGRDLDLGLVDGDDGRRHGQPPQHRHARRARAHQLVADGAGGRARPRRSAARVPLRGRGPRA